ncbi:MAG: asparagine synthase (glutamine-hydrolyzing) [Pseudomonadota bacterium]
MCGIFGTTQDLTDAKLAGVVSLLDHRGPDSNGSQRVSLRDGQVTFAHTRLAIQDLSASGHQPMWSADGRWLVTFNGEIYNHLSLRERLDLDFRGTSDTETLAEYIARFGLQATLRDLNGIFAFGALDTSEGVLYVARDTFGVKPVYFVTDEAGGLTFASEIKPLLSLQAGGGLCREALSTFLTLRFVPSPATLLKDISRLPPGHLLTQRIGSPQREISSYIRPVFDRFRGGKDEAIEGYAKHLTAAVTGQLISDVPVGILLSGGIDSALIAALAREHTSDLTAFTVGFGSAYRECELDDARETARVLDIAHEFVEVDPVQMIDDLDDIIGAVEEPLGTTSIMPMWYLTRLARQTATVVLAGQGNDEPWGGYRRYQIELLLKRLPFLKLPPFRLAGLLGGLFADDGYRRGLHCLGEPDPVRRFTKAYALLDEDERQLLGVHEVGEARKGITYWLDQLTGSSTLSDPEKMMRIDARMNLSDDLLLYGDKISMACALEVRVPMLDPAVVEFVESLPLAYKASLRGTKIVHRAMALRYLPDAIIHRPKKGFQVPFGTWSKTVWRDYIEARLLAPSLRINTVLDPGGIRTIWQHHLAGKVDYSRQLFALLTLSLWLERFDEA